MYVALTTVPNVILTDVATSVVGTEPEISNPKSLVVDEYVLIQTLTMFTFLYEWDKGFDKVYVEF